MGHFGQHIYGSEVNPSSSSQLRFSSFNKAAEQRETETEMRRTPRCSKDGLNRGPWTAVEDKLLTDYISIHGEGKWSNVVKNTGLFYSS
ncbi:r2r3-myb transcription factor, putative [Ricinus communis]|uniref:R2r3-myb transcription factor, putative n=1 Tax=Ricinus communis TaxID=3988 RepID=B9RB39_RICCO|nr:r2r3-myb transcription factor, putative [Ricinus communis]